MNLDHLDIDPFAGETDLDPLADTEKVGSTSEYIHIRIQQRNGRKTLTTLQGLPKEYDPKKLLKAFKKEFACNGTLSDETDKGQAKGQAKEQTKDQVKGQVIQLQGDQRAKIQNFLVENGIDKASIKVHGF